MSTIDSEILITLVEARPVLWDKSLESYKDRNMTRNGWNEVCIALNSEFEELEEKEKNAYGKYCRIYSCYHNEIEPVLYQIL